MLGLKYSTRHRRREPSDAIHAHFSVPFFPTQLSSNLGFIPNGDFPHALAEPHALIHAWWNVKSWNIAGSLSVGGTAMAFDETVTTGQTLQIHPSSGRSTFGTALQRSDLLQPDTGADTTLNYDAETTGPPDESIAVDFKFQHRFIGYSGGEWYPDLHIEASRGTDPGDGGQIEALRTSTTTGIITWLGHDIAHTATGDPITGNITITAATLFTPADW